MAEQIKKTSVVARALHGTDKLFNKIICLISGIFLSAIFFLIMMKFLNSWGIYLGLSASIALNIWLKRKYKKVTLLNAFNNGVIIFNVITSIILVVVAVLFLTTVQNALN